MSPEKQIIAVIEDEAPIRRFLRVSLAAEGFRVLEATTAEGGLRVITQQHPDIILLDLGLPDGDGMEIIRSVRGWSAMPIIVVSARGEEHTKIMALDAGADDYLSKPFSVGELLARIRVAQRHATRISDAGASEETTFVAGHIRVDLAARRVFADEHEVKLTKIEYALLSALIRHAGKVLTHRHLLNEVWGPNAAEESHYVRVFMSNLRKKLERNPSRPEYLLTEQGVGYRFKDSS
jgi:two-component system KDP operon response regulator KdpE